MPTPQIETYSALKTSTGGVMPLGKGVRYRVKTTPKGKKVRLAFKWGKVVEAKALPTKKGSRLKAMMTGGRE